MSVIPTEAEPTLYALTPAVYRIADAELGEPLRALMSVLEEPYLAIEQNIGALYDNWFIETCAPWLVPYIGELVGVTAAFDPNGVIPTVRARVGNAVAYSRRKGPSWVLAHASRDATGWQARAVEFFQRLAQTQDVADVRAGLGLTADLRFSQAVEAGTPFDRMAHTVEVRGPDSNGRWAADRVGLYLWRLFSYPLTASQPRAVPDHAGFWTFDPLGADTQLFLPPRSEEPFGAEPPPWDVPGPLSRALLALVDDEEALPRDPWRSGEYPVVAVRAGADAAGAGGLRCVSADLSRWEIPDVEQSGREAREGIPVALVDPELGRLAFVGPQPAWVRADWSYGFSADLGGGPYARGRAEPAPGAGAWIVQVGPAPQWSGVPWADTLAGALALWQASSAGEGVVLMLDSATYASPGEWVAIQPGRRLWITAAAGQRPCLSGDLKLSGVERSGVILVGVAVDGSVRLCGQVDLTALHCTLGPPVGREAGDARRAVAADASFTGSVAVSCSVLGPLAVPEGCGGVSLADSIVAGGVYAVASGGNDAEAGPVAPLQVARCTLFGLVRALCVNATDSIFVHPVLVGEPGTSTLTCCYAPLGPRAHSPARDRCQPVEGEPDVRPLFTSRRYGDAAFAQLAAECPASILTGAGDGAEMGAFHLLDNPRRLSNLTASIDEFLPNGLEIVVSYVT